MHIISLCLHENWLFQVFDNKTAKTSLSGFLNRRRLLIVIVTSKTRITLYLVFSYKGLLKYNLQIFTVMKERIDVVVGDIHNVDDQNAMLAMLNLYMQDPMGGGNKLSKEIAKMNIDGLKQQANYVFFLAKVNGVIAGLANCFINFSTFRGKQLINIHDFAVDPSFRRKGVGEALMKKIVCYCIENDLCKITLEVRFDNSTAQKLYIKMGFAEGNPPYHFWEKII